MISAGTMALVTGGSSGIGRAVVGALRVRGTRVAVLDRNATDADGDVSLVCDVADEAAVVDAVARARAELGPDGIRVNAVAPGATDTPVFAATDRLPGFRARVADRTPLSRVGSAQEVADAVLAVLDLDWVTGQVLVADGGLSRWSPLDPTEGS